MKTKTRDLIAWMMIRGDGATMWIGVTDNYVLIGRWGENHWEWDVTRAPDASDYAIDATRILEERGFRMHQQPMWMDVDDPAFTKGLERFAQPPHPTLNDHLVRAFGMVVVAMAVAGKPV